MNFIIDLKSRISSIISIIRSYEVPTVGFLATLVLIGCRFPFEIGLCVILYLISEMSNRDARIEELTQRINRLEIEIHDAIEELRDMNNNLEREKDSQNLESGEVVLLEPPKEDLSALGSNITSGVGTRMTSRLRARGRGFHLPPNVDRNNLV